MGRFQSCLYEQSDLLQFDIWTAIASPRWLRLGWEARIAPTERGWVSTKPWRKLLKKIHNWYRERKKKHEEKVSKKVNDRVYTEYFSWRIDSTYGINKRWRLLFISWWGNTDITPFTTWFTCEKFLFHTERWVWFHFRLFPRLPSCLVPLKRRHTLRQYVT